MCKIKQLITKLTDFFFWYEKTIIIDQWCEAHEQIFLCFPPLLHWTFPQLTSKSVQQTIHNNKIEYVDKESQLFQLRHHFQISFFLKLFFATNYLSLRSLKFKYTTKPTVCPLWDSCKTYSSIFHSFTVLSAASVVANFFLSHAGLIATDLILITYKKCFYRFSSLGMTSTHFSLWARGIIFTSAGCMRSLGFITTTSDLEPYITVLSEAHANTVFSYQFGDGGMMSEFIFAIFKH